MEYIRTPDSCFKDLDSYSFEPCYSSVPDGEGGELRIHYLDEGDKTSEIILCLHGQPTWSYLYRKMITPFTEVGYRVIVPDLIGFGKSDKPTQRQDYTYARHLQWMSDWLQGLDISNITLVCQDWGGPIGLQLVTRFPELFKRIVASNTRLLDGTDMKMDESAALRAAYDDLELLDVSGMLTKFKKPDGIPPFLYWIKMCAEIPELTISEIVDLNVNGGLSSEQIRAYDAPFPSDKYKQGARQFPSLVPFFPDDPSIKINRRTWAALRKFDKPFLTAFSDGDPVSVGADLRFQKEIPGAQGQAHATIKGAGHYLQEEKGEQLASVILQFLRANP